MPDIDTSKLTAVNEMLAAIGAQTVNSLTERVIPEVTIAIQTLDQINKRVQEQGWHWNTDLDYEVSPDSNGKLPWGFDWIRFDTKPGQYDLDLVRRGSFLWNRRKSTYVISKTVKGTLVRFLTWDELPEPVRGYIIARATRKFYAEQIGDQVRLSELGRDEVLAKAAMMRAVTDQADHNILDLGAGPGVQRREHYSWRTLL